MKSLSVVLLSACIVATASAQLDSGSSVAAAAGGRLTSQLRGQSTNNTPASVVGRAGKAAAPNPMTARYGPSAAGATTPAAASATSMVVVAPVTKSQAEVDEITRKSVEFERKRAEAGFPGAQYDLGVRYLKGDGVSKDLTEARRWLSISSTNGNNIATKKLQELDKTK